MLSGFGISDGFPATNQITYDGWFALCAGLSVIDCIAKLDTYDAP